MGQNFLKSKSCLAIIQIPSQVEEQNKIGVTEEFRKNPKNIKIWESGTFKKFGGTRTSRKIMISGKNRTYDFFGGTEELLNKTKKHETLDKQDIQEIRRGAEEFQKNTTPRKKRDIQKNRRGTENFWKDMTSEKQDIRKLPSHIRNLGPHF